mmetsp:Transcript_35812/g.73160  ORF Transcript_35812/g.73160 Transcript_35812/m.73160 type:complete len:141 (-) Transcript_35812:200-622(-)
MCVGNVVCSGTIRTSKGGGRGARGSRLHDTYLYLSPFSISREKWQLDCWSIAIYYGRPAIVFRFIPLHSLFRLQVRHFRCWWWRSNFHLPLDWTNELAKIRGRRSVCMPPTLSNLRDGKHHNSFIKIDTENSLDHDTVVE